MEMEMEMGLPINDLPHVDIDRVKSIPQLDVNKLTIIAEIEDGEISGEFKRSKEIKSNRKLLVSYKSCDLFILLLTEEFLESAPYQVIEKFYNPNLRILNTLKTIGSYGFSSSELKKLIQLLWNNQRSELNISIEEIGFEIETIGISFGHPYSEANSIDLKNCFNHSLSIQLLMFDLIELTINDLFLEPSIRQVFAISDLGSTFVNLLKDSLDEAHDTQSMISIATQKYYEAEDTRPIYASDYFPQKFHDVEALEYSGEELAAFVFEDQTGLARKVVNERRALEAWEILSLVMDSQLSAKYADSIVKMVWRFFRKSRYFYSDLEKDLESIESFIKKDVNFQLAEKIISRDN